LTGRSSVALCLSLLLLACAAPVPNGGRGAVSWTPVQDIRTEEPVTKVCYAPMQHALFALCPQSGTIQVHVDGARTNTLGGRGLGSTEFSGLADIALGPDGKLLALDRLRKQIKRFSYRGELLATIELDDFADPRLLAAAGNANLYIYDAVRRDVTILTDPPAATPYRFGRFQLESPDLLACNNDYVWAWDGGQTVIFTAMGQFVATVSGRLQLDAHNRRYRLEGQWVQPLPEGEPLALSATPLQRFWIHDGYMTLQSENLLRLGRLEDAPQ